MSGVVFKPLSSNGNGVTGVIWDLKIEQSRVIF